MIHDGLYGSSACTPQIIRAILNHKTRQMHNYLYRRSHQAREMCLNKMLCFLPCTRRVSRAGSKRHSQRPQQALEVFQIAEVAVNVPKHMTRLLQPHNGRLSRARFCCCLEHNNNIVEMLTKSVRGNLPNHLTLPVTMLQHAFALAILVHMARFPALVGS